MESRDGHGIAGPLAHRVRRDASAEQIADALVAVWQEIDAALTPIIGQLGVAALCKRSLFVTASRHAWLAGAHESVSARVDLDALKAIFVQQGSPEAAIVGAALLQTLYELLTTLVGASLTERLLRSVWTNASGAPPAQDFKP